MKKTNDFFDDIFSKKEKVEYRFTGKGLGRRDKKIISILKKQDCKTHPV